MKKRFVWSGVILLLALATPGVFAQTVQTESYQGKAVASGEIIVKFRGTNTVQSMALAAQDASITASEFVGGSGALLLRSRSRDVAALLQAYGSRLDVEYAEPNYIWHKSDLPNDALFSQQWAARNTGQSIFGQLGTPGADIKLSQAWDITEGSRANVVGIVDSGVDYNHPDLAANMWSAPTSFTVTIGGKSITCAAGTHGFNAITRTCDPMDDDSHGTHVAGIVGAAGNNGSGVSGVNRIASIMALKFLSPNGGTTVDAIAAIEFAIQVKALFPSAANIRVLNNSWGGGSFSQALMDQIALTDSNNMLFVVAAGNGFANNDLTPEWPANMNVPNMIVVAATTNTDGLASFSNWGASTVHMGAPGSVVLSTIPNGLYDYFDGTSMATPMVSGAASLLLSVCPLPTAALRSNILSSVDPLSSLAGKTVTGGRLNVFRALTSCAGTAIPPGFGITAVPGVQRIEPNGTASFTIALVALGSFSGALDLSAVDVPNGMTASFTPSTVNVLGSSIMTLTPGPGVAAGTYTIGVKATSAQLSRTAYVTLTVGTTISVGQTILGALSTSDQISTERGTGAYADYYRLTVLSPTTVTIDLKSNVFDTYLYVITSAGVIQASDDQSGGNNNSRLTTTLAAGTYTIEATSFLDGDLGNYSLSISTPTLATISPSFASPGSTANVTLTGTRLQTGMTVNVGGGITVSDVTATTASSATATFVIPAGVTPLPYNVTVTTSEGTSNPLTFTVPPLIATGERISGSLSTTDQISTQELYTYSDLYRLTLTAQTPVTIDMRSRELDTYLYVLSPSGTVLFSDDDGGGSTHSRINTTLDAGTYFIEASSYFTESTGNYSLSINLPSITSATPSFRGQGGSTTVTMSGNRFIPGMTVNAGTGVTVTNVNVTSPTAATALFTLAPDAPIGRHDVVVATTDGGSDGAPFTVVPPIVPIAVGQSVNGSLTTTDQFPPDFGGLISGYYGDLYQLTITATTTVNISLESSSFDAYLLLLSSGGLPLIGADAGGTGTNARLTVTLGTGTFYIMASSSEPGEVGPYTLSLSQLAITSMTPRFLVPGTSTTVNLTGSRLIAPMTIDAGPGITVSNINVTSLTAATATLTVAAGTAPGSRSLSVTTAEGTSNSLTFTVIPGVSTISVGQTVTGTLNSNDQPSPERPGRYADFYQFTIGATTPLEINLQSTDIDAYLYLLSSTGATIAIDDQSGGNNNARIRTVLAAGTYYIETTSFLAAIGPYTLSIVTSPPLLSVMTPAQNTQGSTFGVTLTGTFFVAPMTIDAGAGITVSNVTVMSATQAIALFTIASDATLGNRSVRATTAFGTSALLNFNVIGPLPSQLNFARSFPVSELSGTGFAIVNPSTETATVTFTMFSSTGVMLGTSTATVNPRGQFARLGSEIFPSVTQSGWVRATSTTVGLQGFWVGGDFTNFMDGAAASPGAQELTFPLATQQTELNIVNLGTGTNVVTVRIYGTLGIELATALNVSIPANGVFKNNVSTLFPSVNLANVAYVRTTGTSLIAGSTVTTEFPAGPSWTVLSGVDSSLAVLQAQFPHVPSGPQDGGPAWTSILGVTNLSTTLQTVTITYTPSSGSPSVVTRTLNSRGILRDTVQNLFNFPAGAQDGWVSVSGTAPLTGFIAYGYSETSGAAAVPVQATPQTNMIFAHVANGPIWGTGLALLNNTNTDANVEVYIMRQSGALVGGAEDVLTASFILPAGTKQAKLLSELVPSSTADDGFVYVRTTNNVPVYGIQLFFSRTLRVIANIAAGTIPPSITFAPPAATSPLPSFTLTSTSPASPARGGTLTLAGTGFNPSAASNQVVFTTATGSVAVPASTATSTQLTVVVPGTATSGLVHVISGDRFTNSRQVSITP